MKTITRVPLPPRPALEPYTPAQRVGALLLIWTAVITTISIVVILWAVLT